MKNAENRFIAIMLLIAVAFCLGVGGAAMPPGGTPWEQVGKGLTAACVAILLTLAASKAAGLDDD